MEIPAQILAVSDVSPISVIVLFILLVVSSFFSMSETVFSSLNPIRMKTFIEDGKKGSKKAYWIYDRFDLTLSTILVGNNLANVALATISVGVFSRIFANQETLVTVLNTLVMTTIILIFGEIIPKSFAKMHADTIALKISGILYLLIKAMRPLTFGFIKIKSLFIKEERRLTISVTEDELETIIDTMEEEGSIDEDEAEMLQSVLDLGEKRVYEIMTPRVDMIAVEVNDSVDTIKQVFLDYQFSRIPVFDNSRDNIIGIITERDFFTCLINNQPFDIHDHVKTPIFVSKSMRVDTLIETLQRESIHLAIVSDEFGGTSGIVTMEDALEELVGEIYDEHDDVDEEYVRRISTNEYGVNSDIELDDLFEELELGPPPSTELTLGSWLYGCFETLPEIDMYYEVTQTIPSYDHETPEVKVDIRFVIKEIKERRIKYVHVITHYHGDETNQPKTNNK